uniref:NADH-ubiquinone oxidoreductase chain 2 n=1 Tax=Cucujoidea sp. 25 KM-2017 TaxID=2219362 RepID=A0A346RK61_9CUCU|nr:NADH dehydrogenase subunit 2 [Cucujoidea sp. 25 KM-2017]
MIKFYKFMFFNTMMFGTLITISAYSWFSMWLGLEINLLSVIPLFNSVKNSFPSESALKYFLTQTMASSIILFAIVGILNTNESLNSNFNIFLSSAVLTKLGAAPFHFWFPEVTEGLNWLNNLIILTWQKIAPMIIIFYTIEINDFFILIIVTSSIIGSIMGMNQISLRKILAFSSINHIGWMLSSMMISSSIWLIYFLAYSFITFFFTSFFSKFNTFFISQLINLPFSNKISNLMFFLAFFSLGGLPPFLGFLPKWFTIMFLNAQNFLFLSFILIIFSLITLFFYLRISFFALMYSYEENINSNETSMEFKWWFFYLLNLVGLPLSSLTFHSL